ncbi:DNA excision repair protein ERCC-6-like 2 isoform X2 [Stylophora pistillata]|uniref:DNA excision repair protein ERCC-6-like 2 isoform X2 n=1 Tax=Stylophora pistillata TaxID=50429 RepID=UPI000C0568AA|nr:DNA excision repair protein ERCC-6-like 2 isoform X2 [Stylophora pistillata]
MSYIIDPSLDVKTLTTECTTFFTHLKGNEAKEAMRFKYGDYEAIIESVQREKADSQSKGDHIQSKARSKWKGKLDVSVQYNTKPLGRRNSVNKKNSSSVIQDVEEDCKMIKHSRNCAKSQSSVGKSGNTNFKRAEVKSSKRNKSYVDDEMLADGFHDQDMIRPSLTELALGPTVPLILSKPGVVPVIQIPATLNSYLREYQRDGVRFLFQHYSENTGAILGDDMGLGKTVQVISFIAAILGKTGTKADIFHKFMDGKAHGKQKKVSPQTGTFLVVSPGSVMFNWRDELQTWGHFKTGLFHGTTRESILERASRGRLDVVLTTYETMRNYLTDLNRIKWSAVIMDEVHRLKDPKAQITVAAKALNVKRRYGLTGTPLQNKLEEFWCVLDWANPGSLGTAKNFNQEFGKPMLKGQTFDATKRELAVGRKRSKDLQDRIGKWFLRRTKDLIADQLPKKDEVVVFCPLTPFQEDVYQTLLQSPDVELIRKKNFPCDCGSGKDRGKCCYTLSSEFEDIKTVTMRFFQLLLKVANHAALLAPTVRQSLNQQKKAKDLCLRVFARYPEFSGCAEMSSFELLSDPKYCGKMKVLEKLMKVFQEDHSKVLLFSRSTQLLNIVEEFVISKGLIYSRLDGGTKPADRTRLVHEFNVDPSIFVCLISTKAGGLGLNFTGANIVIIFDPNWNPSSDLQAQDRAYRIGQRRDVRIYRLISLGTIEEMMYLRQVYKQQLASMAVGGTNERRYFTGVEGDKDKKGELFGLENLFSYRAEGASLSKDIIRRTEKLEAGYKVVEYELTHIKEREDGQDGDGSTNLKFHVDPYNIEELASQFVDDQPRTTLKKQVSETRFEGTSQENKLIENHSCFEKHGGGSFDGMKSKGIHDGEKDILHELDNSQMFLSDSEDFPETETHRNKFISKDTKAKSSLEKNETRRCVSVELFPRSDDDSGVNSSSNNFTKVKEKASVSYSRIPASIEEESYDVIRLSPNCDSGLKSIITSKILAVDAIDQGSCGKERKPEEELRHSFRTSSSSDEDYSDECLFSKRKRKQTGRVFKKRRLAVMPEKAALKDGRERFRRYPGQKADSCRVDSHPVAEVKKARKENTLEEILESCGVHYTHANRYIVGPSEAENHMSKQAVQDVFELRQFSQQPANCFPAWENSDESDDLGEGRRYEQPEVLRLAEPPETESTQPCQSTLHRSNESAEGNDTMIKKIGNSTVFIGSTPRGIRRRHFREMLDLFGFTFEVDLAKAVMDCSEYERREMLRRFYVHKNPNLSGDLTGDFFAESQSRKQTVKNGERSGAKTRERLVRKTSKRSHGKSKPWRVHLRGEYACSEDDLERSEIHNRSGGRTSLSSETKFAMALNRNIKVPDESCVKDFAMNNERTRSVDKRNRDMPTAETVYSLALANLPSTAIASNENSAAGSRDSRLEKDNSRFAVSILDEFLMHDSSSHETKRKEDSDRGLDKWELRISKRKDDKQLNNTELKEPNAWEANSTSLLDEFI